MTTKTTPFPKHGTRARNRTLGCQCVDCGRRTGPVADGHQLRWPYLPLQRRVGLDRLLLWFDVDDVARWRDEGLTDEEADRVAVKMGLLPFMVWGGYIEAGLDYAEVNRATVG